MDKVAQAYLPGVCNINKAEVSKRRKLGHIGLIVFIILLVILLIISISRIYRIILILPSMLAASGYLQARNHFCVGYARAGLQNADDKSTQANHIADQAAQEQDKRKARVMNFQSSAIALVITAVTIALPHL